MSNETQDKHRLISLTEASEIYGFNARFLSELARKQRLKAQKVGSMWVTTRADMEDYISSRHETGVYRKDIQVVE